MKNVRIAFALFVLWLAACASASDGVSTDRPNGRRLITARIAEATPLNADEQRIAPPTYVVKLADIKVIQGAEDFPATLDVELKANHIEVAKNYEKIFAIIDLVDGTPKLRYWEAVVPIACVPVNLISPSYESRFFSEEWNSPNQKCTFVDKYQTPDGE